MDQNFHAPPVQSFILYMNFEHQLEYLTMEERGLLFTAIFSYQRTGQVPEALPPMVGVVFSMIEDTLDRDRAAYLHRCQVNSENGKKGGRPRKDTLLP